MARTGIEKAQGLPAEVHQQATRMVLTHAADEMGIELTPEPEADLIGAQADMQRGEFATDDPVEG